MKKALATGAIALGTLVLLAGCGTAANNNTTTGSGSTVTPDLKKQFVSVNASAQIAVDDFNGGTSLTGDMDTTKVNGKDYDVVADSKDNFDSLKNHYLDFFSSQQVDELFKNVQQVGGKYVIVPSTAKDNLDWYNATVSDVQDKGSDTYQVTLSVPKQGGSDKVTKQVVIEKQNGHFVYGGTQN